MEIKQPRSNASTDSLPPASSADHPHPDDDFMLVLREVEGANKREYGLVPSGPSTGTLRDGRPFTLHNAWFDLIGDMHVRFVIDGSDSMQNLTMEEYSRYGITPEQAVDVAVANIRRRYGPPQAGEWDQGILLVSGDSPDLDTSYFLDYGFWDEQLAAHPEGLVVGVPQRGGLIFAPVSNASAVDVLQDSIVGLYQDSGNQRISSALYLYKDHCWSVYRDPLSSM